LLPGAGILRLDWAIFGDCFEDGKFYCAKLELDVSIDRKALCTRRLNSFSNSIRTLQNDLLVQKAAKWMSGRTSPGGVK